MTKILIVVQIITIIYMIRAAIYMKRAVKKTEAINVILDEMLAKDKQNDKANY